MKTKQYVPYLSRMAYSFCILAVLISSVGVKTNAQITSPASNSIGVTFGGAGNDRGVHSIKTKDNSLVTVGVTETPSKDEDILVVKTNLKGDKIWQKTFGGKHDDAGWHIMECDDAGNLLISGWSDSYSAKRDEDIFLLKISKDGILIWSKTLPQPGNERCWSLIALKDNSYILTGQTQNLTTRKMNGLVTKINSQGNIIWQTTLGNENYNRLFYSKETSSGEILAAGITRKDSASENNGWVLLIDKDGREIKSTRLHSIKNITTHGLLKTQTGDILVYGYAQTDTASKQRTIYFALFDKYGNMKWEKTANEKEEETHGIGAIITLSNNILLTGYTRAVAGGKWKGVLYKFSIKGNMLWKKEFGGTETDQPYSLLEVSKDRFVITGLTKSFGNGGNDMWLVWTDRNGNILK